MLVAVYPYSLKFLVFGLWLIMLIPIVSEPMNKYATLEDQHALK